MAVTAWLHINGTDYALALSPSQDADDASLRHVRDRVQRMLGGHSPEVVQEFEVRIGDGRPAQLTVVPERVFAAAVYLKGDSDAPTGAGEGAW